ncbi:MAG: dTDP-glucose 4,6-dehydratase [Omnitrophica bacterium RIFCSPHIGHO2_02_FULL_51_18]|nr:MAG: dTDP-glucose 4,6-dehydratase [Omnitrophica bacterium RIFCSPHIGHO2_02_FULL_51_18]
MARILITGGAGFIGSYLIKFWLKNDPGLSVVNLDKLTYCGDLSRLAGLESHPRYEFIHGDVCNPALVEKALARCDAVIHLAAETHVDRSLLEAKTFFDTNSYGTYVLLEAARRKHIRKFLYVSTDEVYGSRPTGFFTEKDSLHPTSPYSVSKTAADLMVLAHARVHRTHALVTRGSNTYGPYQYPEKVIPLFVSNALSDRKLPLYGDGLQIRNWLYVEDHCRGIIAVFNKGKSGEAYNLSSSTYLTNRELTRRILKILNKPLSLVQKVKDRAGHDRRYAIDSKKLRSLGWGEKFSFDSAFEETVEWYRGHENWWKAIKEKSPDFKRYYQKAYRERV